MDAEDGGRRRDEPPQEARRWVPRATDGPLLGALAEGPLVSLSIWSVCRGSGWWILPLLDMCSRATLGLIGDARVQVVLSETGVKACKIVRPDYPPLGSDYPPPCNLSTI